MKILELCTSDGVGGLELYVLRTVTALHNMQQPVSAAVKPGTMLQQRLAEKGLPYLELPRSCRHLPLMAARQLARLIDREQIDVVHMHWGHDLFLAALAKRWSKRAVKLVYTRQMALTRGKRDAYHRFLYRQVDLYLTITDKLAQQARDYLPLAPEKVQRLYYGVAAQQALSPEQRQVLRKSLNIPDAAFAIGLVGRMEEQKGQHLLIEAVQSLRSEGYSVHASIIGPAMDEAYLASLKERVAVAGLGDCVQLHGPHKNPMGIMPAFDALVLTTRMETFGLVLAEAMRCDVAVLGTDAGGVPEIIEDGVSGLLFPPDDATALAARLKQLIDDRAFCMRLAAAGKARADDLFAEEVHYHRLVEHFERLLQVTSKNSLKAR